MTISTFEINLWVRNCVSKSTVFADVVTHTHAKVGQYFNTVTTWQYYGMQYQYCKHIFTLNFSIKSHNYAIYHIILPPIAEHYCSYKCTNQIYTNNYY